MLLLSLVICSGLMGFTIYGVLCIYKMKRKPEPVIRMSDIDYGKRKGDK